MMKTRLSGIALILLLMMATGSSAQKEASVWYFGYNAGVKFNNDGSVTALTDGVMKTNEGCASIADSAGNLLFYTDGLTVWNKIHQVMPNGTGLKGHSSSTQSAIIVPKPGAPYLYYIFTVNGVSGNRDYGAYYSLLDMRLDNGKGDLTGPKNVSLVATTDEKITAVKHRNGRDIWIIIPERGTSNVHSFLVTPSGVSTSYVTSDLGYNIYGNVGYLKCSPDGTTLAMALCYQDMVLMASFDNATGKAGNPYGIPVRRCYGIDFSPNSNMLYVTSDVPGDRLLQFNASLKDSSQVKASKYIFWVSVAIYGVQLAINRKIYITNYNSGKLAVIENPNEKESACSFVLDAVDLKGRSSVCGLPSFIQSMFRPNDFAWKTSVRDCQVTLKFEANDTMDISSFQWSFGDPYAKPGNNTASGPGPTHLYAQPGTYHVFMQYQRRSNGSSDTIHHFVDVKPLFNSFKFRDTVLYACPDSSRTVKYYQQKARYIWSTGDTTPGIAMKARGKYRLTMTDSNGCVYKDSLRFLDYRVVKPNLGPDVRLCALDSLLLRDRTGTPYKKYKWPGGDSAANIYAKPEGDFSLQVIDKNGCKSADTIHLNMAPVPVFELGPDTILCDGDSIRLSAGVDSVTYRWQDGNTASAYMVTKPGMYSLTLTFGSCYYTDRLNVSYRSYPVIELGADDSFCGKFSKVLDPGLAERYLWSDGSTSRSCTATKFTTYYVSAFNHLCMSTDSVTIYPQHNKRVFMPNAFTPNNDHVNDVLKLDKTVNMREFSVYDRWGQLIYSTQGGEAWDGTFNGQVCPDGVYLVCITYTDCLNRAMHERHTVHLLR